MKAIDKYTTTVNEISFKFSRYPFMFTMVVGGKYNLHLVKHYGVTVLVHGLK